MSTVTLTLDASTAQELLWAIMTDRYATKALFDQADLDGHKMWGALRDEALAKIGLPSRRELAAIAFPEDESPEGASE